MSDKVKGQKDSAKSKGDKQPKGAAAGEAVAEKAAPVAAEPMAPRKMQEMYRETILPALMKEFGYANIMQAPKLTKISVNIGLGEAIQNSKAIDAATGDLATVTGQKPVVTKAKNSIAVYKLREGMPIGVMVTLRGTRMWDFLDRLINIALPRQRDFQGISPDAFDGRGNYTVGLREQLVFPEIDYDKVDKVRGMEVTIVTSARTDEEARRMLAMMGMPFKRS
jgi:large subunit ribosomal protein L5